MLLSGGWLQQRTPKEGEEDLSRQMIGKLSVLGRKFEISILYSMSKLGMNTWLLGLAALLLSCVLACHLGTVSYLKEQDLGDLKSKTFETMSITTGSLRHFLGKKKGVYRFWEYKAFLP